ncbi:MAG TPA: TetR/AcrR family transcriptional regulator [Phaeodactylibacter sp.]|nr:TetR/AcrR family transcriptional regulator [Phaeodactylibacter sp.]
MKKSEKTRQLIVEKAASLFNQKGYAGTSIQDLMVATGLTKGGIYGNFKKEAGGKKSVKEEIAKAAFEHAVGMVMKEVQKRTFVIENSLDKLKAVVYFYKERVMSLPVEGGCPIMNTSIDADDTQPALRKKVVTAVEYWRERIIKTLERGKQKGEIKEDVNSEGFATLFIGTLEGGILMSRILKDNHHFDVMADQLILRIDELKK